MTVKNVTISSKNQITLPIEFVRKLGLSQNRSLRAELKNGKLELRPEPSLEEIMRPHWEAFRKAHPNFRVPTDEDIQNEARRAYEATDPEDRSW